MRDTVERIATAAIGHLAMLCGLAVLLEVHPNRGLVVDSAGDWLGVALWASPSLLIVIAAYERRARVVAALVHASSPHWFWYGLQDPAADLVFIGLVWWFYVPAIAVAAIGVDELIRSLCWRRRGRHRRGYRARGARRR